MSGNITFAFSQSSILNGKKRYLRQRLGGLLAGVAVTVLLHGEGAAPGVHHALRLGHEAQQRVHVEAGEPRRREQRGEGLQHGLVELLLGGAGRHLDVLHQRVLGHVQRGAGVVGVQQLGRRVDVEQLQRRTDLLAGAVICNTEKLEICQLVTACVDNVYIGGSILNTHSSERCFLVTVCARVISELKQVLVHTILLFTICSSQLKHA